MPNKKPHDTVILERMFVPRGTHVINEGEDGSSAFLIQSGVVQIFSMHNNKKVILSTLQTGEIFGEMSLIRDMPRSASVEALEDCNLIVITRQSLKAKLDGSDATIRAIMNMLIRRLQQGNDSLMNKKPTFEDMQESLLILYEEVLATLPKTKKPHFRQEVLPLIEELNQKMSEYKEQTE